MRWGRLLFASLICSVVTFFVSMVLLGIFYKIYYRVIKKDREISIFGKVFINSIFLAYLVAVAYITYFARNGMGIGVNLKPFEGLKEIIVFGDSLNTELWFMIANILFFMPFGFLLPFVCKKINIYRKVAIVTFLSTFLVEIVQYVSQKGSFDVDDIIYNFVGGMFGFAIYSFFRTLLLESDKKKKKTKILTSFVPLMVALLVVLSVKFVYEIQEYGLIKEVNRDKTDMSKITVKCDLDLSDKSDTAPVFVADNVKITKDVYSNNIKKLYNNLGSSQKSVKDSKNEYRTESVDGKYSIIYDKEASYYSIVFENSEEIEEETSDIDEYEEELDTTSGDSYEDKHRKLTWKSEIYSDNICNQVTDVNMTDEKVRRLTNKYYEDYIKNIDIIHNEGNVNVLMNDIYIEYKFDNLRDKNSFSNVSIYYKDDYSISAIDISNGAIKKYKDEEIISDQDVLDVIKAGKIGLMSFNGIVDIKNISLSYLVDSKLYYRPVYEILYVYGDETQFTKTYIDAMR